MKIHCLAGQGASIPLSFKVTAKQVVLEGLRQTKFECPKNTELCISFVSEIEMIGLCNRFRGKDEPTDVLSFPAICELTGVLGDIVICPSYAARQASELGHSFEREIAFLTAHGLLHLLGYSHGTPSEEEDMIKLQKSILSNVDLPK